MRYWSCKYNAINNISNQGKLFKEIERNLDEAPNREV